MRTADAHIRQEKVCLTGTYTYYKLLLTVEKASSITFNSWPKVSKNVT